ncbi:Branched-chain amino acid transport system 2 carrier protein [Corynebacterium kalinowskii]|uniref:Branched-chain amino acid transport system 2 carrier protein n=1 Tax=Corynebacterium kalinowskii TaxID=2675216 RepID=A0A6B8W1P5_9CORY|nr:branched-chain amino acid transport system II carrier protein [Corynebacterium kalinowskii]QGU01578.1 Branched-chain amino acid transport system 2 carrier protein [Corynebacterium kalinowskii]
MTTADSNAAPLSSKSRTTIVIATSLMLFSMFFGAGNLIFPPMLGVESGDKFWPAIIGFCLAGVALPVIGVVAIALTGNNVQDLAKRGGALFGILFPVLVYLSIGCFYALPRTGVVSFETAIVPITGADGLAANAIFSIIFFGVSLLLALNPAGLVDALGKALTPLLLILLVLLVVLSMLNLNGTPGAVTEDYASAPMAHGLVVGYLTMDSLAALAFGIVVVNALRYKGFPEGNVLVRGVSMAAVIAGGLLAVIYVGLGLIGQVIPEPTKYENGAALLSDAAKLTMGEPGMIVFGAIVLLACITTSVGLIGATSEFFNHLVPSISYRVWAVIFTVIATLLSILGLDAVLAIAGPIIGFLYPPAIALIFLTLAEPLFGRRVNTVFKLALPVAIIWAALMSFNTLGWGSDVIEPIIGWSPMHKIDLGWVVPVLIATVIGAVIDFTRPKEEIVFREDVEPELPTL